MQRYSSVSRTLAYKHEDPSSIFRTFTQKDHRFNAWNSNTRDLEMGGYLRVQKPASLTYLVIPRPMRGPVSKTKQQRAPSEHSRTNSQTSGHECGRHSHSEARGSSDSGTRPAEADKIGQHPHRRLAGLRELQDQNLPPAKQSK